jgi:hypothetical protein
LPVSLSGIRLWGRSHSGAGGRHSVEDLQVKMLLDLSELVAIPHQNKRHEAPASVWICT